MSIQLQQVLTEEQRQQVVELANRIWNEYYITMITQEQIDYMLSSFQSYEALQQQVDRGYQYFTMVAGNGDVVGYASVKSEDGKLFLSKFYLLKEQRGKGYGGATIELLKTLARQQSLTSIWLTVNRGNDASISMYKNKGFVIVREQAADIGNGFVMDDYIMELSLQ